MKTMWRIIIPMLLITVSRPAIGQAPAATRELLPLYVKVQLDKSVKLSSLKPGDVTEGNLARDVYSADRKVFPAGSHVRLTVDHVERTRRPANDRWPWVIKLFTPRHENSPFFKDAAISVADGSQSRLQVSLITANRRAEVHAQPAKQQPKTSGGATISPASTLPSGEAAQDRTKANLGPVMALEAREENAPAEASEPYPSLAFAGGPAILPAGTSCRILLLSEISASKSHSGDMLQARLLEPVDLGSHVVLPAGTIFEGNVLQATPPRMLSRAGTLSVAFNALKLSDGTRLPISASVAAVELNRESHTRIDAEGRMHGGRPGKAWMLINGGVTAGLAKVTDDSTQLILEAILSSATDASTAGTARIAGFAVSGIFLLTRHGRDVILPGHTEMNVTLNRPLTVAPAAAAGTDSPDEKGPSSGIDGSVAP